MGFREEERGSWAFVGPQGFGRSDAGPSTPPLSFQVHHSHKSLVNGECIDCHKSGVALERRCPEAEDS